MATAIDIRELPARLDEALAVAASGGEVTLVDGSTPRARLISFGSAAPRTAGLHAGAIQSTADFDAPLPDEFWGGPLHEVLGGGGGGGAGITAPGSIGMIPG